MTGRKPQAPGGGAQAAPFDPLAVAPGGWTLLEASAGTGKTHSLGSLVLRFLAEGLAGIDQVLMVTFTRAAAAEMAGRVEGRLGDALQLLDSGALERPATDRQRGEAPDAPLLRGLLRQQGPDLVRRRLHRALLNIDQLQARTIDSLQLRLLSELGATTANWADRTLAGGEDRAGLEAARQLWREGPLREPRLAPLLSRCGVHAPQDLLRLLQDSLARGPQPRIEPPPLPPGELHQRLDRAQGLALALRDAWREGGEGYIELLRQAVPAMARPARMPGRALPLLQQLVESGGLETGRLWLAPTEEQLARLRLDALGSLPKVDAKSFELLQGHLVAQALEAALAFHAEWGHRLAWSAAADACLLLARRRRELQRHWRTAAFQDALEDTVQVARGQGAAALAGLRARYRLVLVDEFQDTNDAQLELFRAAWGEAPATAVVAVGDPKQAIYRFRGGDLHAYLRTRRRVAGHFRLPGNYRSNDSLVHGVQGLFSFDGSFGGPDAEIAMPQVRAAASPPVGRLRVQGRELAGFSRTHFEVWDGDAVGRLRERIARRCAGEIAWLLGAGDGGPRAQLRGDGDWRALLPGDLCVLVRTAEQGEMVHRALTAAGVDASLRASRGTVLHAKEAGMHDAWLAAAADPTNLGAVRHALATPLLGLAGEGASSDPWREAHRLWRRRGWLPAFYFLAGHFQIAARLRASDPQGRERALTNLRHLAQLVDAQCGPLPPEAALRAWERFCAQAEEGQRAWPGAAGATLEEERLEVDSDRRLVQVMTMHGAKGLEYGVVFLPFGWEGPTRRPQRPPVLAVEEGAPVWDLGSEQFERRLQTAHGEEAEEALRVLYVAVTRASAHCRLCLPDPKARLSKAMESGLAASALFRLLASQGGLPPGGLDKALQERLGQDLEAQADWSGGGAGADAGRGAAEAAEAWAAEPPPPERLLRPWQLHSYSSLTRDMASSAAMGAGVAAAAGEDGAGADIGPGELGGQRIERDGLQDLEDEAPEVDRQPEGVHAFEGSARAGLVFHEVLEHWDFHLAGGDGGEGGDGGDPLPELVRRSLRNHGFVGGEDDWAQVLAGHMRAFVRQPLAAGVALRQLAPADRLAEARFDFALRGDWAARLREATEGFGAASPLRFDALGEMRLPGLMRGFIDLTFRDPQGRWWVADYKSNRLGPDAAAYAPDALDRAVRAAHYDWQAAIYSVAVHRWLRLTLPDYDPARHFGGASVLFVRGMGGDGGDVGGGAGEWRLPLPPQQLQALDAAFGG